MFPGHDLTYRCNNMIFNFHLSKKHNFIEIFTWHGNNSEKTLENNLLIPLFRQFSKTTTFVFLTASANTCRIS